LPAAASGPDFWVLTGSRTPAKLGPEAREMIALAEAGELKGRRVLISGGGSGFGRAMAIAFSAEGALVAVGGRRLDRLEETSRASGGKVWGIPADVRDPAQVSRLFGLLRERWRGLDVLVNNAAVLEPAALAGCPLDSWQAVLATNLTGPFLMTQAALALMGPGARIVNVTSGLGFFPMAPYGAYCVTKAGLNMLSRVLALELDERGILVNTVDPGVGRTEMNPEAQEPPEKVVPIVRTLAALPPGSPTGRFFKKSGEEIPV